MDFTVPEEIEMLRQTLGRFVTEEVIPLLFHCSILSMFYRPGSKLQEFRGPRVAKSGL